MIANLIIISLITMFVLLVYVKIKSKYNENAYRRDVNRRYREKYGTKHFVNNIEGEIK